MNKCQHGQKISIFCASECCQWKDAGGCETCIKKYHNHMGPTLFLNEQDIYNIVKKYTVDSNVKPKCRILQEAIYNYFNLLKTEISSSLDVACKNIINQIGYPFLYANNTLSTYKRLKNKQYKKLVQKEFRTLYDVTLKIDQKQLSKEEANIYNDQIKITISLLNHLEAWVNHYQSLIKNSNSIFQHDPTLILKINQISKHLATDSPTKNYSKIKQMKQVLSTKTSRVPSSINQSQIKNSKLIVALSSTEEMKKVEDFIKTPTRTNQKKQTVQTPSPIVKSRDISLDKKLVREHKFSNVQKISKNVKKEERKSQTEIPNSNRLENLKKELNGKELEINEKKKILIDMIKQKEESLKNKQKYGDVSEKEVKLKQKLERPNYFKQKTQNAADDKQSNNSSEIEEELKIFGQKQIKAHAFTKLPIEQVTEKIYQQKVEVRKKLIVVPALHELRELNASKISDSDSPLLKKKSIINKFQEIKLKESQIIQEKQFKIDEIFSPTKKVSSMRKIGMQVSKPKQAAKQTQSLELKENQQKSIALLLKAVSLKAEEAILYLQSALKYASNNLSATEYLSYLYLETNRPRDCLNLCNRMLEKMQHSHEPEELCLNLNNNKTAALNILGRYSESIVILEKCLRYKSKDTLYKNLADAYFSISIYEKAVYNYEKALKLNQNYDEAHYNLAVCLYIQENYYNAKLAIQKALELTPKNQLYTQLQANIQAKILSF